MRAQIKKLAERSGMHGRVVLERVDLDLRVWEVRQATGVIQMQMRWHDMPDILEGVTQPGHLMCGCFSQVTRRITQGHEGTFEPGRSGSVGASKTAVHQDEAVVGLDEQAVHDQVSAGHERGGIAQHERKRAHCGTVQVMDTHGTTVSNSPIIPCVSLMWALTA